MLLEQKTPRRGRLRALWTLAVALLPTGCSTQRLDLVVASLASPAPPGSVVPQVVTTTAGPALSWLEPRPEGGYAFRMAIWHARQWSDVRTISAGADILMYGADLPGLVELPDGDLLAHWLRSVPTADDAFATRLELSRSTDQGRTWSAKPPPRRDGAAGHNWFVTAFPYETGAGLVWLDGAGQQYVAPTSPDAKDAQWLGAIGLRASTLGADGRLTSDDFVDPITCECCPTAAATTARGPAVVYRDRAAPAGVSAGEIRADAGTVRDIYLVRLEHGTWTAPRRVHADHWVINACPDNGPAIDARGEEVVVAWWTAAGNQPSSWVAFSSDAGDHFEPPVRVDAGHANGQVSVALIESGQSAIVGWREAGQAWARLVARDGALGPPVALGPGPSRARLPRWLATPDGVFAVWTAEVAGTRSVRAATLVPRGH